MMLDALTVASQYFANLGPHIPVLVAIASDSTTDNSRELVHRWSGMNTIRVAVGRVGASRNAGIPAELIRQGPTKEFWIANTDTDTEVPEHLLQRQFELTAGGAGVVVDTAEPRSSPIDTVRMLRRLNLHQRNEDHPHIEGALMGFRADTFAALGG